MRTRAARPQNNIVWSVRDKLVGMASGNEQALGGYANHAPLQHGDIVQTHQSWCFQSRHVPGVENRLADGLTRWPEDEIADNLQRDSPGSLWQVQKLGDKEQRVCAGILREATHLEELHQRLERLMKDVGGCG